MFRRVENRTGDVALGIDEVIECKCSVVFEGARIRPVSTVPPKARNAQNITPFDPVLLEVYISFRGCLRNASLAIVPTHSILLLPRFPFLPRPSWPELHHIISHHVFLSFCASVR